MDEEIKQWCSNIKFHKMVEMQSQKGKNVLKEPNKQNQSLRMTLWLEGITVITVIWSPMLTF